MKHYVGIDEVGRGPAAGPVTVCAVCWKSDESPSLIFSEIKDSKQLSEKKRNEWAEYLIDNIIYFDYEIHSTNANYVDERGINEALLKSSTEVINKLGEKNKIKHILSDYGLPLPKTYSYTHIKKGDEKETIIAMASILAKVYRDTKMCGYSKTYPKYNWDKNKGYLTKEHIDAIIKYGITQLHRKTFLRRFI